MKLSQASPCQREKVSRTSSSLGVKELTIQWFQRRFEMTAYDNIRQSTKYYVIFNEDYSMEFQINIKDVSVGSRTSSRVK